MSVKLLHIASFIGNVGDNASHMGLENILSGIGLQNPVIERLEIRKFYKNYQLPDKLTFDESFAHHANSFDGIVIGGGGFLDYWVPDSSTGTTLDMEPKVLGKIKRPLIISSVGALPHQTIPEGNITRFRNFLDAALGQKNVSIALRNDGSHENIKNKFGAQYSEAMHLILDNAFFYMPSLRERLIEQDYVAINLAPDQLGMLSYMRGTVDQDDFYRQIQRVIEYCIGALGLHIVLIPHIQADLKAIVRLLGSLESFTARSMVSVAPCVQGNAGAELLFSIYRSSRFVLASRFHANVCSAAMLKPTVGIAVLDRVGFMYDSLDMENAYVLPGENLADELIRKLSEHARSHDSQHAPSKALLRLKARSQSFYEEKLASIL
ncbi:MULTISPECIES: polysaccharide pyruvyl transferase family protein [Pseudomonadaceae]|uniref:polysaccharide pyruvyl transferase family protein n=1 Tax=Pseudomonadaceae TaxID=135621 RepID=UPI0013649338|nr:MULTISPECIES: polysaccharide pyruvyl transferase family protein [Pseudomonadaceae]MBE7377207.1 polysaccharide pyruvyl transferase family protein [Pseudomonas lopnurensis]